MGVLRKLIVVFCLSGLATVSTAEPEKKEAGPGIGILEKEEWDSLKVTIVLLPGCTEPEIRLDSTITRKGGEYTVQNTKHLSGGDKQESHVVRLSREKHAELFKQIVACLRKARKEESFSEKLERMDPVTREKTMQKQANRPIGGYARSWISVAAQAGHRKHSFSEEFGDFDGGDGLVNEVTALLYKNDKAE
ncbi:hypothetical protein Rhal01_03112 [Rubritalea halochordaticola]|uniref:Uncharacterized protein n=1 Tax=Rubritalea halochordaticola TaxID=714537 RepID=A0ABP9V5T8_9BACT